MRAETIQGIKKFFKNATETFCVSCLCCGLNNGCICPWLYDRKWLKSQDIKPIYNRFFLIKEDGNYILVLFLQIEILNSLTEEVYSEIIKKFEIKLKETKEQLKLNDLQKDF